MTYTNRNMVGKANQKRCGDKESIITRVNGQKSEHFIMLVTVLDCQSETFAKVDLKTVKNL